MSDPNSGKLLGRLEPFTGDPTVLPFLPLIYVAWADGDLTPDEIRAISRRLLDRPWMQPAERDALGDWLQPDQPPSPASLQALLAVIRERAGNLPESHRQSLVELGMELSRQAGGGTSSSQKAVSAALTDVQDALGMASPEAVAELVAEEVAGRAVGSAEYGRLRESTQPATFDLSRMTALFEGEYADVRRAVFARITEPPFEYLYGVDKTSYRERVLEWVGLLAADGFGALGFPKKYGGAADLGRFIAAFEALAFGDLSVLVKFGVQFGLFGGSVMMLGTDKHHEAYLRDIGSLKLPGCFAMTESGHGSNVSALETEARFDPATDQFVVHTPCDRAHKEYIGNAACHARMATVFVQLWVGGLNHGVHAILVPIRKEDGTVCDGVRIEDSGEKMGLNGVDNGRIWFDQVRVPRANLLDRYAQVSEDGTYTSQIVSPSRRFFTMLGALVAGRVSVAKGALSAAKSGLTIAVRYGERRRQFGSPGGEEIRLMDYRTHQRRLLPRIAKTYAVDFGLKYLSRRFLARTDENIQEVEALAAGLKAYSCWHTIDVLQNARECCGGAGYLAVNRFAALRADTDVFATFEGDNTVLMQLVAKGRLTHYRQQFNDLTAYKMMKYLGGWTSERLGGFKPFESRAAERGDLLDVDFHRAAFAYREAHLLHTVARRLKNRIDRGMDSFQALNDCQLHLVASAEAYIERVLLDCFVEQLDTITDADQLRVLKKVCDLFALSRIEATDSWYLDKGYLAGSKSKAIRRMVTLLCEELRPEAVGLVDSFGIPDALLAAPIAFDAP